MEPLVKVGSLQGVCNCFAILRKISSSEGSIKSFSRLFLSSKSRSLLMTSVGTYQPSCGKMQSLQHWWLQLHIFLLLHTLYWIQTNSCIFIARIILKVYFFWCELLVTEHQIYKVCPLQKCPWPCNKTSQTQEMTGFTLTTDCGHWSSHSVKLLANCRHW